MQHNAHPIDDPGSPFPPPLRPPPPPPLLPIPRHPRTFLWRRQRCPRRPRCRLRGATMGFGKRCRKRAPVKRYIQMVVNYRHYYLYATVELLAWTCRPWDRQTTYPLTRSPLGRNVLPAMSSTTSPTSSTTSSAKSFTASAASAAFSSASFAAFSAFWPRGSFGG